MKTRIKYLREGDTTMKKSYKIEVDCANCANKMEEAAKNTAGVDVYKRQGKGRF